MARVLNCEYDLTTEEMAHISHPAKDLVSKLLVFDLNERLQKTISEKMHISTYLFNVRMSARECLEHPWLQDEEIYVDMLQVMIILAMMMIKMMITFAGA